MKMKERRKEEENTGIRACFAIVGWIRGDGISSIDKILKEINQRIFSIQGVESKVYLKTDIAKLFVISEREISKGEATLPGMKIKIKKIK